MNAPKVIAKINNEWTSEYRAIENKGTIEVYMNDKLVAWTDTRGRVACEDGFTDVADQLDYTIQTSH